MKKLADGMYRLKSEGALEILTRAQELESQGRNILHFEIGEPDFPTPESVKNAAKRALDENHTKYVNPSGIMEFRETIGMHIEEKHGFKPSIDQITVVPGVKTGIFFSMIATCSPNDEVLIPNPGFPTYESLTLYLGSKPIFYGLYEDNDFNVDIDEIDKKVTDKTKAIIINSPNNPTGGMIKKKELDAIRSIAEENDCYVISDEIYSDLVYETRVQSIGVHDECKERSIIIDGFSKSYSMTGWRLGYLIAPSEVTKYFGLIATNALTCTSPFIQRSGLHALNNSHHDIARMVKKFNERRDHIVKRMNRINGFSCYCPPGAFYVWPNITGTGKTSGEMADYLLEELGIACLAGTSFGSNGEGYLRFSYASSLETINEALDLMETEFN